MQKIILFIIGWFLGAGLAIIAGARPEKRKKYVRETLIIFIAFFLAVALPLVSVFFLNELTKHLERRQKFKNWKKRYPVWNIKTNDFMEFH